MASSGTLQVIFDELLLAIRPIGSILSSPDNFQRFLEQRGFSFGSNSLNPVVTALGPARTNLVDLVEEGLQLASEYAAGTADEDDYIEFSEKLFGLIASLRDLPDQLATLGRTLPSTLGLEIFDVLLVGYLASGHPVIYRIFVLLGLIEQRTIQPGSGDALARDLPYAHIAIRYDRIATLFREPGQLATDVYGWNTPSFNSDLFLLRIQRLFTAMERVAKLGDMSDEAIARMFPSAVGRNDPPNELKIPVYEDAGVAGAIEVGVVAMPVEGESGANDGGIAVMPYAEGTLAAEIDVTDTLSLSLQGHASFEGGFAFIVRPSGFDFEPNIFATKPSPEMRIELARKPALDDATIILLGSPDPGSRLECDKLLIGVGGNLSDFYIVGGVLALRAAVSPSKDGLLGTLLPNGILVEAGDVLIGWRPNRGIYFEKGASLRVVIPVNKTLGPVRIAEIEARLAFDPDIMVGVGVSADLTIGPLFMSAKGLGIALKLTPKPRGRFGGFDLEPGLLLPTGYAAAVNAGPITGGGAVYVEETGYKGALALRFTSFSFSAFAILTTKMPSGQPGFSFLATIFFEFEIQLGFGFKLTGLGGIIGIHRVTNVEALQEVLMAGNLDGLLFPPNPIQDAARILNEMEQVWPVRQGTHVFGPMAKLGWPTPTLIEAKLGVIIELGPVVRILILGEIKAALPSKDSPVLILKIDFLGVIDFGAKTISLDATLKGSRILQWPLSGEMALRTGWYSGADFIFSCGGFHPDFPTPANFPSLQRLTIAFGSDNPRITFTAYFAVTLNTFQTGARLELYLRGPDIWAVGKFDVDGLAYFNALIRFNPFSFDVALGLALTLLRNGDVLCSIGGDIRLTGPNPYHIKGRAWAEVCHVTVKVPVDKTFGDSQRDEIQTADVLAMFVAAVAQPDHWEPVMPTTQVSGVSFVAPAPDAPKSILVDPVAGVRFSQRLIPLRVSIDKMGTARLANEYRKFELRAVDSFGATVATSDAMTSFPTGQFFNLSEDEQFRVPATEQYRCGLEIAGTDALEFPAANAVSMSYEYETLPLLGDDDEQPASLDDSIVLADVRARLWSRASLESVARPRNFGYVRPELINPVVVDDEKLVVVDGRAKSSGVVAAKDPAGRPLVGSYGELRGNLNRPGRSLASAYLAAPDSLN